ncbi:MAG: cytochrome c [Acidobacteriota bacterium]|nr:cytochrome c [Acidobacteriota bacterium]
MKVILPAFAFACTLAADSPSGQALFAARCASCHNENGAKALPTGLPLSERKLSQETIAKAVRGRMSKNSDAERQAVAKYIASFQQTP